MYTSCIQKLIIYRNKDNVTLNLGQIFLELSSAITGTIYIYVFSNDIPNKLISDNCRPYIPDLEIEYERV